MHKVQFICVKTKIIRDDCWLFLVAQSIQKGHTHTRTVPNQTEKVSIRTRCAYVLFIFIGRVPKNEKKIKMKSEQSTNTREHEIGLSVDVRNALTQILWPHRRSNLFLFLFFIHSTQQYSCKKTTKTKHFIHHRRFVHIRSRGACEDFASIISGCVSVGCLHLISSNNFIFMIAHFVMLNWFTIRSPC